jgi:hypothetical protein
MTIAVNLPLPQVAATDFGADEEAMTRYRAEGTRRALAMANRGPARLDAGGRLGADIVDYNLQDLGI